jgi:MFS family permease
MLPIVCTAAFLIFVQAFMVAPLIPRLAEVLHTKVAWIGLAVPAYLLPHGTATLIWGPLSDRLGRRTVILGSPPG